MERAGTIDWEIVTGEAVGLLSEYLRIDTVNPPGNEVLACDWLARILDREGIPYRLYARDPNRPSLVATLPGDHSRGRGLVLLNHTDVVPAESGHWSHPPLSGLIEDGYVWGRGAMDMKGMGILELMVFLLHHRLHLPLRRDLTFFAVADEEAGGAYGIDFLSDAHPELFDCDFVLNEGGTGGTEVFGVRRSVFHVGVAEKGPLWLKLRTTGTPGHGSVPHDDNALERLVRALERLNHWERPLLPSPEVLDYFERLHDAGVLTGAPTPEALSALAAQHPRVRSMQTNSLTVTMLSAGVRPNVIPAEAEATIDVRLVAGYDPDRFIDELRSVIDDPRVVIDTIFESSTPASPTDTDLFVAIERAVAGVREDALVVPSVSTGFTDSRVFRRRGIPAYGFIPILLEPEDTGRAHGNDERVSIEALRTGLRVLHATVREVCA